MPCVDAESALIRLFSNSFIFYVSSSHENLLHSLFSNIAQASTKDCMFVLLIIDTAEKPIIEMQRVTYENGKPKLKHYLDDIPFDYYVTVRDITALPEVLGDSLRQWWESINK